ncbi:conjugal transfer protein TraN [Escherichia coli O9,30:H25]
MYGGWREQDAGERWSVIQHVAQQQGRNGQLRISFGSAKHPDCRGITVTTSCCSTFRS